MPANTAYENCLLENRAVSLLENLPSSGWLDQLALSRRKKKVGSGTEQFWEIEFSGDRCIAVHASVPVSSSLYVTTPAIQPIRLHFAAVINVNTDVSWLRLSAAAC